ncbi:MAG: cephalosporin hydroxylase family protein [Tagaea sp.]|nr:cephalosporin hydroxylase family protein [Tagaea sp.]
MDDLDRFQKERAENIARLGGDSELRARARRMFADMVAARYHYNFDWAGLPIIQFPEDILAVQELVWRIKPGAIVETGVARGGSVLNYASLLALLGGDRVAIGVDIDIRAHNRARIEAHPLAGRVRLIEGSSVDPATVAEVTRQIGARAPVLVVLDSNHTHDHVLQELRAYARFATPGSYVVVFDTVIEFLPAEANAGRPWGEGNSPHSAVAAFLRENKRFEVDKNLEDKLLFTCCPGGFLRCVA